MENRGPGRYSKTPKRPAWKFARRRKHRKPGKTVAPALMPSAEFLKACDMAGVKPTRRQQCKYTRKDPRGAASKYRSAARLAVFEASQPAEA